MDLFVVDRYMGDVECPNDKDNESVKLKLLKKHIEKRKRKLAVLKNGIDEVKDTIKKESSPKKSSSKKNKKLKKEGGKQSKKEETAIESEDVEESVILNSKNESFDKPSANKTKKKKRKHDIDISNGDSREEDDTEITTKDPNGPENSTDETNETLENSEMFKTDIGFTVIGKKKNKKNIKKVEKPLPDWLANPRIVDTDLSSNLLPVDKLDGLSSHIQSRLQELQIKSFFPIQKAVIPTILKQMQTCSLYGLGGYRPSDICVSAPTGSGKTLSYVIPIVQALSTQTVCLLQALVLLPTKDLACQVKQVFDAFIKGTCLKVGLASGNKALAKEQESLIGQGYGSFSRVNILVATPGRLVDHLSYTLHFTLEHLRFLVIDEADRLLDQSYHDWLNKVLGGSYVNHIKKDDPIGCLFDTTSLPTFKLQTSRILLTPLTPARFSQLQIPLQKLLFSATMTQSPEKLAPLQLSDPVLFVASKPPETLDVRNGNGDQGLFSRYSVPHGLVEYMVVCNNGEKPLMLLYLMTQKKLTGVLCFTSSLEATHRLCLLVKLFGGIEVAEYSSNLNAQQRHGILRDFRQGTIQLLICSDAMARGMDIDNVSYVISYDAPKFVKTYIHRVGRTARAGNQGTAFTLLHSEQVHHFKELIQKTGREKIPKQTVKDEELKPLVEKYQSALGKLEETVKNERQDNGYRARGQDEVEKYLKQQLMENIEK